MEPHPFDPLHGGTLEPGEVQDTIVTDAVTGVANAYSARSPLLLIGGAAPLGLRGLGALQETEQVGLLRPITKGSWTVAETRQIPEVLTTAIRTALTGRPGPVFVEIPVDLLMTMVEDRLAPIPTDYVHRRPQAPDGDSVARLPCGGARSRPARQAGRDDRQRHERAGSGDPVPHVRGRDAGTRVRATGRRPVRTELRD